MYIKCINIREFQARSDYSARQKENVVIELPSVSDEVVERYELVYRTAYPLQGFPVDFRESFERMLQGVLERSLEYQHFLRGTDHRLCLFLDQFDIVIGRSPLAVLYIRAPKLPVDQARFDSNTIGEHIDLMRLQFTPGALQYFVRLFPRYVERGDVLGSARHILSKASEEGAINEALRHQRSLFGGSPRFFRFKNCLFVIILGGKQGPRVVTIQRTGYRQDSI